MLYVLPREYMQPSRGTYPVHCRIHETTITYMYIYQGSSAGWVESMKYVGFRLDSFQLSDYKSPALLFIVTTSPSTCTRHMHVHVHPSCTLNKHVLYTLCVLHIQHDVVAACITCEICPGLLPPFPPPHI